MTSLKQPLIINSAEQLTALDFSNLPLAPGSNVENSNQIQDLQRDPNPDFVLRLLQPLADPEVLAQCRGSQSNTSTSSFEELNVQHLSTTWRRALAAAPPIPSLTFDLALPDLRIEEAGITKVLRWNESLAIIEQDVINLVHSIATVMRMRIREGGVEFKVVNPGDAMMKTKAFSANSNSPGRVSTTLQQSLDAIAGYRRQEERKDGTAR